jgi:hypothetical protein
VVLLGVQRDDSRSQWSTRVVSIGISGDQSRSDLDLLADLEHSLQDTSTSDTTLQILDFCSGLVHIERSDDDHSWVSGEVVVGGSDVAEGLDDGVNVEPQLRGDGNDWGQSSGGT